MVYNKFSEFLLKRYGTKVYKLPVNIPSGCPNRDGTCGSGGCIFCGEEGAGFETLPADMGVAEQLAGNANYIGQKYNAEKFIAYFQNYSNTYLPFQSFTEYMEAACVENAVALYISTRPDCIDDKRVDFLKELKNKEGVDIVIELGLQSVNSRTLRWLNRGHGLAEFVDAVQRIKNGGLGVCAHMINDLPSDEAEDVAEGAKFLSALGVEQVKCHSLYILDNTQLGAMFREGGFKPLSMEAFIGRTILFLEYLDPNIVVQRLIGRAPQERTLFCSWDTSWWKVHEAIEERMESQGLHQGRRFNYLNGSVLDRAGLR
ncbi:MAG TPA: TIGR01212 family radical SAM protein [Clostridia bacterium]|nr:TIGR01212 family radical SAM protein [Clostridia bacterium]